MTLTPAASEPPKAPDPPPQKPPRPSFAEDARALVRTCEAELASKPDSPHCARLHYEVARLYEGPLRDLRRAAAHYQEALNHAPEHLAAIRGARRVLIARKGYQAAPPPV